MSLRTRVVGALDFTLGMQALLEVLSVVSGLSLPSLVVTLAIHVAAQRRAAKVAFGERQRQLVEDVLEVVTQTMRRHASLARYVGAPAEVDFGALYPRVLLAVGKGNEDIAGWVWRQVQHMLESAAPNEPIRIGGVIAGQLMSWQRGNLSLTWFRDQLALDPVADDFQVPLRTQLSRLRRQAINGFAIGALVSAGGVAWKLSTR